MFRHLLKRWSSRSHDAYHQLVTEFVARMTDEMDLGARLDALVESLAKLPGNTGAMVAAFDGKGQPFCYRNRGISLPGTMSPYTTLIKIREAQIGEPHHGDNWVTVSPRLVDGPQASAVASRLLRSIDRRTLRGMVVIALEKNNTTEINPRSVITGDALSFCESAIRDAIRLESMKLHSGILQLAAEELSVEQLPINTQKVVEGLLGILKAGAVTLIVDRFGRRFLSATTDLELEQSAETFEADQKLTNFVIETGQSLRLRNAMDAGEVGEKILSLHDASDAGKDKKPSLEGFRETDIEALTRSEKPYRLMVIPMRIKQAGQDSKEKTVGCIRVLREEESCPFTHEEEQTLQQFADFLGAELDASWLLHIYGHIRRTESEAICISRQQHGRAVLVFANPGAEHLFRLSSSQIIGRSAKSFYSSDVEHERIQEFLRRAKSNGQIEFGPVKSRVRADNELVPVYMSFRFIEPDHKSSVSYTVAVLRDISSTERMIEQHERLMALLDKQGLAYFLSSEDGRTVQPTLTESRLTGYSIEELTEMSRERLYIDPEKRKKLLNRVHAADGHLVHTLQHLRRKNRGPFFAEGVIRLLKDSEGRLIGYEGLYEDVTDRIRLQGYLDVETDRVLREKELVERLKDNIEFQLDYTKSLGHQLRAPLGAILHTLLNLREQLPTDVKWDRRLRYAVGQAQTWRRLIDNFGFMDKLLRGESFSFAPINLAKLAIETRFDFMNVLPERKLRLHVDVPSIDRLMRKGDEIWGHEGLFRQALVNLIDNAIKYSHPYSEIKVRAFEAGPLGRALEISNKGLRIPKGERETIFLRGHRAQAARDSTPDGFGMGLWLVRKIVQTHGASIRCDETTDQRTAFRIYFPYEAVKQSVIVGS